MFTNLLLCPICWTIGGVIYSILALFGITSFKYNRFKTI